MHIDMNKDVLKRTYQDITSSIGPGDLQLGL